MWKMVILLIFSILFIIFLPGVVHVEEVGIQSNYSRFFKEDYNSCFFEAAEYYGVNPYLLITIARVESGMNPKALNRNRNGSYDIGIMQINTSWIPYLKKHGIHPGYLWHPCYNIYIGAMVLRQCINLYKNTWKAVDCYNKGKNAKHSSRYVWRVYRELKSISDHYAKVSVQKDKTSKDVSKDVIEELIFN